MLHQQAGCKTAMTPILSENFTWQMGGVHVRGSLADNS